MKAKHPVRNKFAGRTTCDCNSYYATKGHAINAFDSELHEYGMSLDHSQLVDYNGNEGRALHNIVDDSGKIVGAAVFSWYRMPSGRYEFTGYIA